MIIVIHYGSQLLELYPKDELDLQQSPTCRNAEEARGRRQTVDLAIPLAGPEDAKHLLLSTTGETW